MKSDIPSSSSGSPLARLQASDPMLLLNPGRARPQKGPVSAVGSRTSLQRLNGHTAAPPSQPQFQFTSTDGAEDDDGVEEVNGVAAPSQGRLLERMHRTQERSQLPQRGRKRSCSLTDSETSRSSKAPARSFGGGSGGAISQHLKDKREELQKERAQASDGAMQIAKQIETSLGGASAADGTLEQDIVDLSNEVVDLTTDAIPNHDKHGAVDVDLTQDAAEGEMEFYVVNGKKFYYDPSDPHEKEVCYGRLDNAKIMCHTVPNSGKPTTTSSEWPSMRVELVRGRLKDNIVKAYDPAGRDFGNLDPRASYHLKQFLDSPVYRMRLEARIDSRPKQPYESPGQETSQTIVVFVNLFGPRKYAVNPVGKSLQQHQLWLRTPKTMPNNVELFNPHSMDPVAARMATKAAKAASSLGSLSTGSAFRYRTVEEAQMESQSLFDKLQNHDHLELREPDANVISELLPHQKQALSWMLQRETPINYEPAKDDHGTLWRCTNKNGIRIWHHVITGHEIKERPQDMLGGLLADMMGLGKTLSLLSLLSYTRTEALDFESNGPETWSRVGDKVQLVNVKTTLLVCPVSVITNWEEQITQHLREDSLTYYIYHGNSRRRELDYLRQFDVVLTSYNTIKSELYRGSQAKKIGPPSPLALANFFRVVLDEAHTIRNPSAQQTLACIQINAVRRWALTATPVQNKLEDFGALLTFLGCFPFNVSGIFAQFILGPFKTADPQGLKNLRLVVDHITLRRLKDKIDLAPRQDETVMLNFSPEEHKLYSLFASDVSQKLKAISSSSGPQTKLSGKGFMTILQSILCLRQICAHGQDLVKETHLRQFEQQLEGKTSTHAIDVEEEDSRPALEEGNAYTVFELMGETNTASCVKCAKQIQVSAPDDLLEDEDEVYCTMMPCYQILCTNCIKDVKKEARSLVERGEQRMVCPFCEQVWRIAFCNITANGLVRAAKQKEDLAREPKRAKMALRYQGPSTKTTQLVARLKDTMLESKILEDKGEMPIKSVVFSAWVDHLELISIALERHGIDYLQMVGSMSRKKRRAALDEFRESRTSNVLLVTIGTGGVGLNLTVASRVYLMDIGFNPMAELQAVDRVHRLGQRRQVTFTRYIMHNSIEARILEVQKKKMDLADLSMQRRAKLDKAEAVRARLEELKSLFK